MTGGEHFLGVPSDRSSVAILYKPGIRERSQPRPAVAVRSDFAKSGQAAEVHEISGGDHALPEEQDERRTSGQGQRVFAMRPQHR